MSLFIGVHGTSSDIAKSINDTGFQVAQNEENKKMFGRGVYMYDIANNGKNYAYQWALYKIKNTPNLIPCVIVVHFLCPEENYIEWTEEYEKKFLNWLNQNKNNQKISPNRQLTREIQNKWRIAFVKKTANIMQGDCKMVIGYSPLPPQVNKDKTRRHRTFIVKDIDILPDPPYTVQYGDGTYVQ